ncbi:MAG: tyrosine-type recombinase/integrase [Chloroflexi bacterium]|nr:tyrosine-type recombinase/integrase [Chloroflexota bacterium]
MKQTKIGPLSDAGQQALGQYRQYLECEADLHPTTVRNYLGDLRLFMAWYETWGQAEAGDTAFSPERVATPTITRYRDYLQHELGRKPATVNRYLISIKGYFDWAANAGHIQRDPARVVKLVEQIPRPPRHLSDKEESDLVAAVTEGGHLRDYTLVVLLLHTGLRVGEACQLKWEHVTLRKRSGYLQVWGKRNKYREVPINATVRKAMTAFKIAIKPAEEDYIFISQRTKTKLTPRGIHFITTKYASKAGVSRLRSHDLRHRFGYRMAERVPLHRLAQIMGHDSLDTTMLYVQGTPQDLQQAVESIAWE